MAVRHLSSAELVSEAQSLNQRWGDLPFAERRAIVEAVVSRITVGTDEVQIDLVAADPLPPDVEPPRPIHVLWCARLLRIGQEST